MATIQFTESPTLKTVKPYQTVLLNSTGRDVVLKFVTAPDLTVPAFTISAGVSAAIDCICIGAARYYSSHGQNYAIAEGSTAVLTFADQQLSMVISP
ncbi:MAG TPA: hypothetical protein VF670_07575 [Duganella sp.]|jgi:hypothetical protein